MKPISFGQILYNVFDKNSYETLQVMQDVFNSNKNSEYKMVIDAPDVDTYYPMLREELENKGLSESWFKNHYDLKKRTIPNILGDDVNVFLFSGKDKDEYEKTFNPRTKKKSIKEASKHFETREGKIDDDRFLKTYFYSTMIKIQEHKFFQFLQGKTMKTFGLNLEEDGEGGVNIHLSV